MVEIPRFGSHNHRGESVVSPESGDERRLAARVAGFYVGHPWVPSRGSLGCSGTRAQYSVLLD